MPALHPGGSFQFYLEPQYSLLSVYLALPFFYDIVPALKKRVYVSAGISVLLFLAVLKIYNTHSFYEERLSWYRKVITQTQHLPYKKLILRESEVPMDLLKLSWGASTEFWFLSTLETGQSRSIIIEEREGEFDEYLPDNKIFLGKWGPIQYAEFDNRYFIFQDTFPYRKFSLTKMQYTSR